MNEQQIDQAIDRVAARLVETGPDDGRVMRQVMARLPERAPSRWFMAMPVQLAAAAALVTVAFVFARPSNEPGATEPPALAVVAPAPVAPAEVRIPDPGSPIPVVIARRTNARRAEVPIDRPDHEFSLPPVEAVEAIELSAITTPAFEPVALEALAPLVLTDLPLASDPSSPHER